MKLTRHQHFWEMAREIRAYCRAQGLQVLVKDSLDNMTCGFVTDCAENDPRHREWRMRLADVSLTANDRRGGFDGLSEEDMIKITHPHLMGSTGREKVAQALSLLPSG
jgi:hypothetical protein